MLTLSNREQYGTLLDSATLHGHDDDTVLTFIGTTHAPQTISRQLFKQRSVDYAQTLANAGITPSDVVIIAHESILESMFVFWGALCLGAIPSMFPTLTEKLDPAVYQQQLANLIRTSGARAIITHNDFASTFEPYTDCPIIRETVSTGVAVVTPTSPSASDIAFLQHSSGTTGLQKGVALSHEAVLNQLASYSEAIDLQPDDVIVSWLPLYHDMGLIAGFLLPLVQGIPLVLMSPFDWVAHPALLLQTLHDYRGTLCWLPNFAYNHMARRIRKRDIGDLSLAHVRAFINCSEPVQAKSHALFAERFSKHGIRPNQLAVSYAMAENTFAVTQTAIGDVPTVDSIDANILQSQQQAVATTDGMLYVSCGKPIAHTQVRVLDSDGNELGARLVGELVIKSDCMLTGYHNRHDLQAFTDDGWYFTGDMGYMSNGEVYIVGRKKDLIINAGKNVYPQDIEAIVNTITGVHAGRCVVFGVHDERDGTELIAVLVERAIGSEVDDKDIKRAIRRVIAQQTTVSAQYVDIVPGGWLVKTSSGKIARDANRDKWLQSRST
ncbi:MAG: AMP-binding protein [Chloroflexota bacterium]